MSLRLCIKCHKNLKLNPACILKKKNNYQQYLICNKCIDTEPVKKLLNSGNWDLIFTTPTIKEFKEFSKEENNKR